MIELAAENATRIGAGHSFIIFLGDGYFPVQCLNAVKNVNTVARVYCATANPTAVVVAKSGERRGIIGVLDGYSPLGKENEKDVVERKNFLRTIGYKA